MRPRTDVKQALERVLRKGNPSAAFILARLYDEGWGVPRNPRRATSLYLKAAAGGLEEATYYVGAAYAYGTGVKRDEKRAFSWFQKAARSYSREGAYMEAIYLLEGRGCRRQPKLGLRLLLREARTGSTMAMDFLADRYWNDGKRLLAKRWAERAAKGGDGVAAIRLRHWRDQSVSANGLSRAKKETST